MNYFEEENDFLMCKVWLYVNRANMQEMQGEVLHVMGDIVRIQIAVTCELSSLLQEWEMKIIKLLLHVLNTFNIYN